jgi:P27 family predicted phage terminase small subunit
MPTQLKLLRGNPGHQRLNKAEPQPAQAPDVPEPPPMLSGYAVEEWRRLAPELYRLRLLTVADLMPFAAYCSSYARWRMAEEALARVAERDPVTGGLLVKGSSGDAIVNPLVRLSRQAADNMVTFAGHFGLSPAARARIASGIGYEPPDGGKFDGLLA